MKKFSIVSNFGMWLSFVIIFYYFISPLTSTMCIYYENGIYAFYATARINLWRVKCGNFRLHQLDALF